MRWPSAVTPPEATSRLGLAEMADEVLALGRDVAVVEVDQHHLGLRHVLGLGLARGGDGAGHHEQRHAGLGGPGRLHGEPGAEIAVRLEERGVRRLVGRPMLGQGTHRHPALAVAEHDLGVGRDHRRVGCRGLGHGLGRHAQHRWRQAQRAHSKWSGSDGDPRQQLAGVAGAQDAHRLVAGRLGQGGVERHRLVPELAGVLVDRGEQGRCVGEAHIGLVEGDLGGVDRLGGHHAAPGDLLPVPGVGRLALPQRRHRHGDRVRPRRRRRCAPGPARRRPRTRTARRPGCGCAGRTRPGAASRRRGPRRRGRRRRSAASGRRSHAPGSGGTFRYSYCSRRAQAIAQARAAEIVAPRPGSALAGQGHVDQLVDRHRQRRRLGPVIEVEGGGVHQNGTSRSSILAVRCMASWKPPTAHLDQGEDLGLAQLVEPDRPADLGQDLGHRLHGGPDRRLLLLGQVNHGRGPAGRAATSSPGTRSSRTGPGRRR